MSVPAPPLSLLRCPSCGGSVDHQASCAACGVQPGLDDGLVDYLSQGERQLAGRQDVPEPKVNAFYEARPFPGYNPGDDGSTLLDRCLRSPFLKALDQAVPPDATVLDAGCGTGQIPAFLALSSAARTVVGVDACRASLGEALGFRARAKIPNLHLVRGNLLSMPVPEAVFDVVNCRGVVHHNQDWQLATRRVARHVRPGGVLVLGFYESIARLPHRMRRGVAKALRRYRPLALFDPILRRRDLDDEKKVTWIEDQYHHPLEWCPAFPDVLALLEGEGFSWVRSVPPVPGREGLFDGDARPGRASLLSQRIGWALSGADEDAGLVCLVARRRG